MTLYTQELLAKRRMKNKEERIYFMVQKSLGAALIFISLISAYVFKEPTLLVFCIPIGLGVIFTKERVITI